MVSTALPLKGETYLALQIVNVGTRTQTGSERDLFALTTLSPVVSP